MTTLSTKPESDPACWHADEGPGKAYRMLAGTHEGSVTLKIMGDTLATTPAAARAFAAALVAAADEAEGRHVPDARHIAAFSPSTCLALIEQLKAAEDRYAEVTQKRAALIHERGIMLERIRQLEQCLESTASAIELAEWDQPSRVRLAASIRKLAAGGTVRP